ncbi:MAG: hypoxanthine phosphoribosyltransferase [Desulfosudaceae bacterium]
MPEWELFYPAHEIRKQVTALARRISSDYDNNEITAICVLKGAVVFFADLMRALTLPVTMDFIGATSYGAKTASSGDLQFTKRLDSDITGKQILLIEDIVDTGKTTAAVRDYLLSCDPAQVKICALISKTERRNEPIHIDYAGFAVDRGFLVGYGMDFNERYRELDDIYRLTY